MGALHLGAGGGPGVIVAEGVAGLGQGNGLHHLAHGAVCQHHGGHAVLPRQMQGAAGEVGHLLDGGRREDQHMEVAVAGAAGDKEVVGLGGLDAAETGAAALDVDDQGGQVCAGEVGDTLSLQGDAGAGGGGHGRVAGGGDAIDHVDGRDLALGLEEGLGHFLGHVRGDLGLRGDGIAEVVAAAGQNGGLREGFVPLHQNGFTHKPAPFLSLHGDDAVGAHHGAACAADALLGLCQLHGGISFGIESGFRKGQNLLRTCRDAQAAALADFLSKG